MKPSSPTSHALSNPQTQTNSSSNALHDIHPVISHQSAPERWMLPKSPARNSEAIEKPMAEMRKLHSKTSGNLASASMSVSDSTFDRSHELTVALFGAWVGPVDARFRGAMADRLWQSSRSQSMRLGVVMAGGNAMQRDERDDVDRFRSPVRPETANQNHCPIN